MIAVAPETYPDIHGVAFADVRRLHLLPERPIDWPRRKQIKNPNVCRVMHALWRGRACWWCNETRVLQAHHIITRWDDPINIFMCCEPCHVMIQHAPQYLDRVLRNKWAIDPTNTDWRLLTLMRGSWWPFNELDQYGPAVRASYGKSYDAPSAVVRDHSD